jgi:hypothetical protein
MAELTRVPAPRSPFDGRWGRAVGFLIGALVVAVVKPWDGGIVVQAPATPRPLPSSVADGSRGSPAASTGRPAPAALAVAYDAASLGSVAPPPAWEVWATGQVSRSPFAGPADPPSPAAPDSGAPAPTGHLGGPVADLGPADRVTALALNRPIGFEFGAVRLWRFPGEGQPERIELAELAPPWPVAHVRVFGISPPGTPSGTVLPWRPGLYRLDLLVEPVDRIRMVMLIVRDTDAEMARGGADRAEDGEGALESELLLRLPAAATLWAFGPILTGWARASEAGDCRVADMWLARKDGDPCRPQPIGGPSAIGVNLPEDDPVVSIGLTEIDPLPGALALRARMAVEGRPGLALVEAPAGGFADGIYRLDVRLADGHGLAWYVEIGPESRRWMLMAGRRWVGG